MSCSDCEYRHSSLDEANDKSRYFANCHPNAPFLDKEHDNNIDRIRSSSALLFLSILSVGARFWGASSK